MIDSYWQWMTGLVLAVAIAFILAFPKLRRASPAPEPDVVTEAAGEPIAAPQPPRDHWQGCYESIIGAIEREREQLL